jgi:hypothetical protein
MFFAPVSYSLQAPLQAFSHRLDVDRERSSAVSRCDVCETEKVERLRRLSARSFRFPHRRPAKLDEPGLLGMEREPVFGESLSQRLQHSLRVLLVLKAQNEVVGEAHFVRLATQARLHFLLEPFIQHVVKIQVCQQGADYLPLTNSRLALQESTFVDHPDIDPFAYQRARDSGGSSGPRSIGPATVSCSHSGSIFRKEPSPG